MNSSSLTLRVTCRLASLSAFNRSAISCADAGRCDGSRFKHCKQIESSSGGTPSRSRDGAGNRRLAISCGIQASLGRVPM